MQQLTNGWTPEQQWLCRLARGAVRPSTIDDLASASPSLDWHALLAIADRHGVTELLRASLLAAPVPAHVKARLDDRVMSITASNLSHVAQLMALMSRFAASGIRALAFKGPTLCQALYGDLGRRGSADLDVLVDRRDAARVRALLLADGYMLPTPRHRRVGSLIHGLYPKAGRDDTLLPPSPSLAAIDVHIGFAYWTQGLRLDSRAMFHRSTSIALMGTSIPTLCIDDLLHVLAIHGMMHGWCALRLVADIDGTASLVNDWEAVLERARSARMLRVVLVALLLSHRVLGTSIPDGILARARRDHVAMDIVRSIVSRLFDSSAVSATWEPKPWFLSFQDDLVGRWRFHARDLLYEWLLKWPWDQWLGRMRRFGTAP